MEALSRVIGLIYDAALDPTRWQATLREIAVFMEAALATLIIEDDAGSTTRFLVLSEETPASWQADYVNVYMRLNPLRLFSQATAKTGDIVLISDFMSRSSFELTRFYSEFLKPAGLVDNAAAIVDRSDGLICVLAAGRSAHQGAADETTRERLSLLAPHVGRALAISRCVDMQPVEAALQAELIDSLHSAVFFLTPDARIVHCNRAGASLGARVPDLRILNGAFAGDHFGLRTSLRRDTAAWGDANRVLDIVAADGTRLVGHLVTLSTMAARMRPPRHSAAFALFVRSVTPERLSYGAALQQRYGLTARELSVVVGLVETGGVPEVAALLGLSIATVKSYLKTVFAKTAVRRQADLVQLAGAYALH